MPYLKIDAHGAIIRAQFMGVRFSEHRLLASNYKSPKEFEAAVRYWYGEAVIENTLQNMTTIIKGDINMDAKEFLCEYVLEEIK